MNNIDDLPIKSLLLLRLALDDTEQTNDIEQDIFDLYLFPERLECSYPDEWRIYIKRKLSKLTISENELESLLLSECIRQSKPQKILINKIKNVKPRFLALKNVIDEIQITQTANNVSSLKTPLHIWLDWVIS